MLINSFIRVFLVVQLDGTARIHKHGRIDLAVATILPGGKPSSINSSVSTAPSSTAKRLRLSCLETRAGFDRVVGWEWPALLCLSRKSCPRILRSLLYERIHGVWSVPTFTQARQDAIVVLGDYYQPAFGNLGEGCSAHDNSHIFRLGVVKNTHLLAETSAPQI